jgi:hypothetical protein
MGVTLYYPSTGEPTHSVALPNAAHNQPVAIGIHQAIGRTASGVSFVQPHGGTFYRITRTFESLTETESKSLLDFLETIVFAGREIRYSYVDARNGETRNAFCRVVYPTKETKIARSVRDISLVFEQFIHPDHDGDASSVAETAQGGGVIGDGEDDSPAITSGLIAYGKVGEAFTYTITAVGAATITFGASGMPAWMSRTDDVLSGTPTTGTHGIDPVTITATNGDGVDSQTLRLHIEIEDAEPEVDALAPEWFGDGVFFYEETDVVEIVLELAAAPEPTLGTPAGSLAPDLTFDEPTLTISGTIDDTAPAIYTWTLDADNDEGTDTATVVINTGVAPLVTGGEDDRIAYEGDVVSWPLTVTAYQGATQTPNDNLPDGLTYSEATRTISGTVAAGQEGDYTFTVEFDNPYGTDTATVHIHVAPLEPVITSDPGDEVDELAAVSFFVVATGKPAPTYSLADEPVWLSIDADTGEITGTAPSVDGMVESSQIHTFDVIATNSEGSDTQEFTLEVFDVP